MDEIGRLRLGDKLAWGRPYWEEAEEVVREWRARYGGGEMDLADEALVDLIAEALTDACNDGYEFGRESK